VPRVRDSPRVGRREIAGKGGVLGAKDPHPFDEDGKWRAFWTQQHGDNTTFELMPWDDRRPDGPGPH
jgi:hypothetical protein